MAALENGLAAVAASSGMSAQFMAIATIVCNFSSEAENISLTIHHAPHQASNGDNIVARLVSTQATSLHHKD